MKENTAVKISHLPTVSLAHPPVAPPPLPTLTILNLNVSVKETINRKLKFTNLRHALQYCALPALTVLSYLT